MPFMNMLYRTYEANIAMAGKSDEEVPLSLLAHMTANAQLEITVDKSGEFLAASEIAKENGKTIIPVTEASASRSSGIAPHALCDTLSYIAGDFGEYLADKKASTKANAKFEEYLSALEKWNSSEYATDKIKAIYCYIAKRRMMTDLIKAGIYKCADDGTIDPKKAEKALVRFRVQGTLPDAVWQDKALFDSYTSYYLSFQNGERDICYLSGEKKTVSTNHPKGIVSANYGAKLISANDTSNFVFRGRFNSSAEACAIGYEASQKAHSALTWLAARQGVMAAKRTFICWNPNGREVPKLDDPFGLTDDPEPKPLTEEMYKQRLLDTINGYRGRLDNNDDIVVIGLDAATTGRLSVTYYNELKSSDFYDRLLYWGESCAWYFTRFTADGKPFQTVLTPFTKSIVSFAFGTERGAFVELDEKLLKEQTQRILSCMLDRKLMPYDIVNAIKKRASNPQAYSRGNRERVLSTACAVIAKYYRDKGVCIKMALDYENHDRSYLFGRLLAVLEKAERITFKKEETREPNAIRLQSAFVNHPMSSWKILEGKLNPYFQRMNVGSRKFYKDLISEIIKKISDGDPEAFNRPLGDMYLIGYYLQRDSLNTKTTDENKEDK